MPESAAPESAHERRYAEPESALPDRAQRLLLVAALGEGAPAIAAWEQWSHLVPLNDVDPASQRLIPLLARNLRRAGIDHPDLGRMRGIHRYWWSRNQILLRKLPAVLDMFRRERIDTMLLKGVPLALGYYDDVGLRPMADFDVMVRTEHADRAVALLHREGWLINEPVRVFRRDGLVDTFARPGVGFVAPAPDTTECDIHWHMLHDCCWDGADDEFWARAQQQEWQGESFLVPQATDLLFHVIVHGAAYNKIAPIRWIADAAQILRTAAVQIDWDRFIALAVRRRLTVVVGEALGQLAELVGVHAPLAVEARLGEIGASWAERREYRRRLVDTDYRYTIVGRWCELSRQYGEHGLLGRIARIPEFMQQIWSVDNKVELPVTLAFRIVPAYVTRVVRGKAVPAP
jgi:Uncharacterised nucleotidyltransferase